MSPRPLYAHPVWIAWALLPRGWGALDLLAQVAARWGWSPQLDNVGWWLCYWLANEDSQ